MRARQTACVDTRVLRRRAIVAYVAHRRDGGWIVGARGFTDRPPSGFASAPLAGVLEGNPECRDLIALPRGTHAWRAEDGSGWTRRRLPAGPVHLRTYEVRGVPPRAGAGGAYVNAWVRRPTAREATRGARAAVRRAGYAIVREVRATKVRPDERRAFVLRYVRQAEVDGEVLVFHRFPGRAPATPVERAARAGAGRRVRRRRPGEAGA